MVSHRHLVREARVHLEAESLSSKSADHHRGEEKTSDEEALNLQGTGFTVISLLQHEHFLTQLAIFSSPESIRIANFFLVRYDTMSSFF